MQNEEECDSAYEDLLGDYSETIGTGNA